MSGVVDRAARRLQISATAAVRVTTAGMRDQVPVAQKPILEYTPYKSSAHLELHDFYEYGDSLCAQHSLHN